MKKKFVFVYVTFSSKDAAILLAQKCLENKLIACANIFPETISIYQWKNSSQKDNECVSIFKTLSTKTKELTNFIKNNHEYECPCIMSFDVDSLNENFSIWMQKNFIC